MIIRQGLTRAVFALTATYVSASGARAQGDVVRELSKPDVVLGEPFSLVRGARELPDGRLIVTDWLEQRLAVIDFSRGAIVDRAKIGAGPTEIRLPGGLFPFRGDSTLLVDVGNGRLAVLDGEGRIVRTFAPPAPAAASPSGVDGAGRLYFAIQAWHTDQPLPGDTVEIAVVDAGGGSPRAVARVHGITHPPSSGPHGPRVPFVVFARQDAFAVASTGRIAVVRGGDYSVEWIQDGRVVAKGPAHPARPVAASSADRTAYVRQFLQSSPMSGRGEDGGLGHTPAEMITDAAVANVVRNTSFAETLPFVRPGDVRIDTSGRVWVGRWVRAGERRIYDIFDGMGGKVGTVRLAEGRQLLAVGRRHAYVIHTDDDDLQTLERYTLPV
ncbi:MAG: hypothetical protein ACREMQ_21865 [Longimicrobiales bacterium]